jgi:hypothetical protein
MTLGIFHYVLALIGFDAPEIIFGGLCPEIISEGLWRTMGIIDS